LEKQRKEYARLSELEQAAFQVKQYDNYIDRLLSVHKDCCEEYNWHELANANPPPQPKFREIPKLKEIPEIHDNEKYYQNIIDTYKPTIFAKIFGIDKRKIKKWQNLLINGREEDVKKTRLNIKQAQKDYETNLENYNNECEQLEKKYREEYEEYTGLINFANSINRGDLTSYVHVIQDVDPFNEIKDFGSEVEFTICTTAKAKAIVKIHDDTVIPKQSKSLLKSGKLNIKDLPIGRFNEIYQDNICSVSIRIARDLLALLPLEEIIVTAKGNHLNKSTGKIENVPLLSVLFIRETMNNLNFDAIDPSDTMKNFKCNMSFKKGQGMDAVKELDF
jgi:hypothetical protein